MSATKSKTLATWLAVLFGSLGLHRFYLHGLRDPWGWLHPLPTFLGVMGIQRVQALGQDDHLAWLLMPLGGLSIAAGMLAALIYGLMPDERWNERHNHDAEPCAPAGWPVVFGVIAALFVGAAVLISVISFGLQRYFEWQVEAPASAGAAPGADARGVRTARC
jgi:TM2 domain-containing membrane protein YozV